MTTEVIERLAQRSAGLVAIFSGCGGASERQNLGANQDTDLILWGDGMVSCETGHEGPQSPSKRARRRV